MRCRPQGVGAMLMLFTGIWNFASAGVLRRQTASCYKESDGTFEKALGHIVSLSPGHSIEDHLKEVGIDEEGLEDFRPLGEEAYFAVLDEDKKRAICGDENVREITDDSYAVIIDEPKPYPEDPTEGVGWGLALLSAAGTDIEEPYSYEHMKDAGKGVDIYIIDTGINNSPEFEGRLHEGQSYADDGSFEDGQVPDGHGTIVANFAGGKRFGTSKAATLWNYKVLKWDDDRKKETVTESTVIEAMGDIIVANRDRKQNAYYKGAVINISVRLKPSDALEVKTMVAIQNKMTIVTAAGNDNFDARDHGLCTYDGVICVGAIGENLEKAKWTHNSKGSNWGDKVTLWAPGHDLKGYQSEGKVVRGIEGTSFASPLVAGVVAGFAGKEGKVISGEYSGFSAATARQRLLDNAQNSVLRSLGAGSPNILANNGISRDDAWGYVCNDQGGEGGASCQEAESSATATLDPFDISDIGDSDEDYSDDEDDNKADSHDEDDEGSICRRQDGDGASCTPSDDSSAEAVAGLLGAIGGGQLEAASSLTTTAARSTITSATSTRSTGATATPTTSPTTNTAPEPTPDDDPVCFSTEDDDDAITFPKSEAIAAMGNFVKACKDKILTPTQPKCMYEHETPEIQSNALASFDDDNSELPSQIPSIEIVLEQIRWADDDDAFEAIGGVAQTTLTEIISGCAASVDGQVIGGTFLEEDGNGGFRQWSVTGVK